MAQLIAKQQIQTTRVTGQFSDGSDRQTVTQTMWRAQVLGDDGISYMREFDHDPTPQEILDALPVPPTPIHPSRKADLERYLVEPYTTWLRWRTVRQEAQTRTAPAPVITALTNREDAAWTTLISAIQEWRTAQ